MARRLHAEPITGSGRGIRTRDKRRDRGRLTEVTAPHTSSAAAANAISGAVAETSSRTPGSPCS